MEMEKGKSKNKMLRGKDGLLYFHRWKEDRVEQIPFYSKEPKVIKALNEALEEMSE